MRQQIVDLVNARGEMTFRELCCELNMFSPQEIHAVEAIVDSMVEGFEDCPECKGEGTQECGSCDGDGHWTCDECNGLGSVDCSECDGEGVVIDAKGRERDCDACEDGEEECDECESGLIYCEECDDGRVDCDFCNSLGEVESELGGSLVIVGPQSLIPSSIIKPSLTGIHQ